MRLRSEPVLPAVVSLAAMLTIAGCGSNGDEGGSTRAQGTSARSGTEITIENFAYEPETLRAELGDTMTVTNSDDTDHTVTADNASIDTGPIAGGGTATFELTEPKTIRYHCDIHNYMRGTVRVTE